MSAPQTIRYAGQLYVRADAAPPAWSPGQPVPAGWMVCFGRLVHEHQLRATGALSRFRDHAERATRAFNATAKTKALAAKVPRQHFHPPAELSAAHDAAEKLHAEALDHTPKRQEALGMEVPSLHWTEREALGVPAGKEQQLFDNDYATHWKLRQHHSDGWLHEHHRMHG